MGARGVALRVVVGLCALVTGLLLGSGAASAALTHEFVSSFGSFSGVEGVAVDQSSGDVYVYDAGAGSVLKVDASGAAVNFSSTGTNVIEGVGNAGEAEGEIAVDNSAGVGKGDIYVANGSTVKVYGADGGSLGELTEEAPKPWGRPCGVAVDSSGSVYVGLAGEPGAVNKYTPAANPVSDTDYSSSLWELTNVCGLAVDSTGSVYVDSFSEGPVTKYGALQFSPIKTTPEGGVVVSENGRAAAVDTANDPVAKTADDLYVARYGEVAQYEPAGPLIDTFNGLEANSFGNAHGVAVNTTSGDVYVADDEHSRIEIFGPTVIIADATTGPASNVKATTATLHGTVNPNGVPVTNCEFEYGHPTEFEGPLYGHVVPCSSNPGSGNAPVEVTANVSGLLSNVNYNFRLVVSNENGTAYGQNAVFLTFSPPLVDSAWVTGVHADTATLHAQINPMAFAATYRFEYGTDTSYGTSVPIPDANIGSGSVDVSVDQTLEGLKAGTTYHYRVVASSAEGITESADHVFMTNTLPVSTSDTCPNASIRSAQFSSYLPDCRAYELVSPADKSGGNIATDPTHTQSSSDGNAIKYDSTTGFADAHGMEVRGAEYVAQRSSEGWSTHSINPEQNSLAFDGLTSSYYVGLSEDLSKGVFFALTPVTPDHPNVEKSENLYLRDDILSGSVGTYQLLSDSLEPRPTAPFINQQKSIAFAAASADWKHIVFETDDNLTAETVGLNPEMPKAYEWDEGTERLVGILPDGEPAEGSALGASAGGVTMEGGHTTEGQTVNSISADGSRVVFVGSPMIGFKKDKWPGQDGRPLVAGTLYMRVNHAETIQLNVSERSEPDPNGSQPAVFTAATPNDSKVFFMTGEALTDNAVVSPGELKLYMYDFNATAGHHLTLISVDNEPSDNGSGLDFGDAVVGLNNSGSYVYFVGENQLLPGMPQNQISLYLWHDGVVRNIASHNQVQRGAFVEMSWGERSNQSGQHSGDTFRVSADGKTVFFISAEPDTAQQAGYDNAAEGKCAGEVPLRGRFCYEAYVYNAETERLRCASCDPSGARPTSDVFIENVADNYPAGLTRYLDHALSTDGRYAFFDTADALVPQDTNGKSDVYEYDVSTGEVHLISSGSCDCASFFVDASPDGANVFFTTRQKLVRADFDTNVDLYDARIDGGIPSQNAAPVLPCEGDDCQGPAKGAPAFSLPASSTFSGVGNPKSSPKSVTKPRRKPSASKHHKKKRRRRKVKTSGRHALRRAGR